MKREYQTDLSQEQIERLISNLETYRDQILPSLNREFVSRLADEGIFAAQHRLEGSLYESYIDFTKEFEENGKIRTLVIVSGKKVEDVIRHWYTRRSSREPVERPVNPILMAEFGSGQFADPTSWRGTFPGQTNANRSNWTWFEYEDETSDPEARVIEEYEGGLRKMRSYGTKPRAPMLWAAAAMGMYSTIRRIAQEVYG